ncbi:MAG: hypothetical protein R3B93_20035 [Bacteroidia bacterium]
MHRIILAATFLLISIHILLAQENQRSYKVFINDKINLHTPEEQWESLKQSHEAVYAEHVYDLIQLAAIPTEEEKRRLTEKGISLLHYVPNYAWIAKLALELTVQDLNNFGVFRISQIHSDWKIPDEMVTIAPDEQLSVRILFLETPYDRSLEILSMEMGVKVISSSNHWVDAIIMGNRVVATIAQHPLVQYINSLRPRPYRKSFWTNLNAPSAPTFPITPQNPIILTEAGYGLQ